MKSLIARYRAIQEANRAHALAQDAEAAGSQAQTPPDPNSGSGNRWTSPRMIAAGLSLVICVTAGLMIGTSSHLARGTDLRGGRNTDLISLVQTESHNNAVLADEVSKVRAEVDALSSQQTSGTGALDLEQAGAHAHTGPVRGPGVTVVLDDAPDSVKPPDVDEDLLIVHQQDIQAVVNALWAGGAEAMTIQGQRVVSTTGVKCVGNTVVLHGIPYAPPYRIEAIGNQNGMERELAESEYVQNYQDYVAAYGLGYQQRRENSLSLPGFTGSVEMQYADGLPN